MTDDATVVPAIFRGCRVVDSSYTYNSALSFSCSYIIGGGGPSFVVFSTATSQRTSVAVDDMGEGNSSTTFPENIAIRIAPPTEISRSLAVNAQPAGGEEGGRSSESGASQPARQLERVAVAIFYNKTHLRVTASVVRSCGTMAL